MRLYVLTLCFAVFAVVASVVAVVVGRWCAMHNAQVVFVGPEQVRLYITRAYIIHNT